VYTMLPSYYKCNKFYKLSNVTLKDKLVPYLIYALWSAIIPVSRQSNHRWLSHKPNAKLPLLFARAMVTFPAAEHRRPLASTKLHCLVTEAYMYGQHAQSCYVKV